MIYSIFTDVAVRLFFGLYGAKSVASTCFSSGGLYQCSLSDSALLQCSSAMLPKAQCFWRTGIGVDSSAADLVTHWALHWASSASVSNNAQDRSQGLTERLLENYTFTSAVHYTSLLNYSVAVWFYSYLIV